MRFSRTEKAPQTTAVASQPTRVTPEQLRGFEDFKDLGMDDLIMISHFFHLERMRPGVILFDINANDNRDYLLLEGQIDLIAADGRRTEIPADSARAKQPIARLRPRKFKAEIVLPSTIISIDRDELVRLNKLLKTEESIRVFDVQDPHLSAYPFYLSLTADLAARRLNWFVPRGVGQTFLEDLGQASSARLPAVLLSNPVLSARLFRCGQLLEAPIDPDQELKSQLMQMGEDTLRSLADAMPRKDFKHPGLNELWHARFAKTAQLAATVRTLAERAHYPDPADLETRVMWSGIGELLLICYADRDPSIASNTQQITQAIDQTRVEGCMMILNEWSLGTKTQALAEIRYGRRDVVATEHDQNLMALAMMHVQAASEEDDIQDWRGSPAFIALSESLPLSPEFSLDVMDQARNRARYLAPTP